MKYLFTCAFLFVMSQMYGQADVIEDIESVHKSCLQIKFDSVACSRLYFFQLDSMVNIVFAKAKMTVSGDEKIALIKDQLSWAAKKETFYKRQDQNFLYNLQEGAWKKDMIRVTYEEKAEFLLKRIKLLLKKLID